MGMATNQWLEGYPLRDRTQYPTDVEFEVIKGGPEYQVDLSIKAIKGTGVNTKYLGFYLSPEEAVRVAAQILGLLDEASRKQSVILALATLKDSELLPLIKELLVKQHAFREARDALEALRVEQDDDSTPGASPHLRLAPDSD